MPSRKDAAEQLKSKAIRLSEKNDLESLYTTLGISIFYKGKQSGVKARSDYSKIGKNFTRQQIAYLQKLLCNTKTKRPKKTVENSDWFLLIATALVDRRIFTELAQFYLRYYINEVWYGFANLQQSNFLSKTLTAVVFVPVTTVPLTPFPTVFASIRSVG